MKPTQNPLKRALIRPTRKNAINAMCAHCMGCTADHIESGFRKAICDCTSTKCPLFSYRPYQIKKRGGNSLKTILTSEPRQGIEAPATNPDKIFAVREREEQI